MSSENSAATRTRKPPASPPTGEAKPVKPRRTIAIDPETQAMRRIENVLVALQESDASAPLRVLEYLLARRRSRAMLPKAEAFDNAGP